MCANLQRLSALELRVFLLLAPWLGCRQSEAQQMILAAAFSMQLGLHGSAPQRAAMIREEKNRGRKGKECSLVFPN